MSKYKEIKGFKVQTLASDTAASVVSTGTWSSGGNMNTAREVQSGAGTQTSAIAAGGNSPANAAFAITEEYNGSAWSEVADLNNGRNTAGGFGANAEATITYGGRDPGATRAYTESWNGSAWTAVNDMNQARFAFAGPGVGTSTSGIAVCGSPGDTLVETWDGTNWTEVAEVNTRRTQGGAAGAANTAAIAFGGYDDGASDYTANAEVWNGSSWTEVADLNTKRSSNTGSGTSTAALCMTGRGPSPTAWARTESWNGTSWTEVADLAQARYDGASANSSPSTTSIMFGGKNPPSTFFALTEEWTTTPAANFTKQNLGQVYYNSTANAFKVTGFAFPTGTWASNTASPTATTERWGTGLSNSDALIQSPPGVSMEWNGSSWTNGGTTNFNGQSRGATGGISAALIWGGSPDNGETEQYNGTAWTEVADLNTTGNQQPTGPTGTYTDTITAGRGPGWQAVSESWNGSAWTETSDLNTARRGLGSGGGSSTDAAVFGGNVPPNNASALTETWNGSSWTETTDLNTARFSGMGFGNSSQSVGYVAGGSYPALPPYNVKTEFFNGSTWTEVGDLANGRYHSKGGGTGASALTAGGYLASPSGGTSTENAIWTVDQDNLTITVS